MQNFRLDNNYLQNISQEPQELQEIQYVIKYQLLSKFILTNGKSRFDQLATAYYSSST